MGKQRIQDKSIGLKALQGLLTPDTVTGGSATNRLGFLPLGEYKGQVRFFDLDKLVNQPLVQAEQLHILGVLDGREEDYDLQTLTIANGAAVGTVYRGELPEDGVPAGEVWYINAVELVVPADAGGTPAMNWRCSLWTDRIGESEYGQAFHAADVSFTPGGGSQWDEFTYPGNFWAPTNKPNLLRLPAGEKLTVVATNTLNPATAAMECVARIYGFIGKKLVD